MTTTFIMQVLVILCAALGQMTAPDPIDRTALNATVARLVRAYAANGIRVPGPISASYVTWAPAGVLGGGRPGGMVLSTRLRSGDVQHMAMSTIAHELGHAWALYLKDEQLIEAIGTEALAWEARRSDDARYAFVYNLRRRFGIAYLHNTDNDGFLLQQGFTEAEVAEMRQALKLMGEPRYATYYGFALPRIFKLARSGELLEDKALDLRMPLDDTAYLLEEMGLIRIYRPKGVRMAEMP